MAALVVLLIGAAATVAGATIGWSPLGRGLFTAGVLVVLAGVDLIRPTGDGS